MFESITLGPFGSPNASIDAGLLAECLLFYRKVRVITSAGTFVALVRTCGAEELLELCDMGCLEIVFLENMTGITSVQTSVGECHDLSLISSPKLRFSIAARKVADEEGGLSSRKVKHIFDKLHKVVERAEYDKEIAKGSEDLNNRGYLEECVKRVLSYLVPEYILPEKLVFRPELVPKFGFRYETNIDFAVANEQFHKRVSEKNT